jgi:hypothetical protein
MNKRITMPGNRLDNARSMLRANISEGVKQTKSGVVCLYSCRVQALCTHANTNNAAAAHRRQNLCDMCPNNHHAPVALASVVSDDGSVDINRDNHRHR